MDFGVVTRAGDPAKGEPDVMRTIFTTHQDGKEDATPLQMVSAARLARLLAIERAYSGIAAAVLLLDSAPLVVQTPAMSTGQG